MMSLPADIELDVGGVHHGLDVYRAQVVAIEVDVEDADRHLAVFQGFDLRGQALRERDAAAADPDEGELDPDRWSFPESRARGEPASGRFRTRS